MKENQEVVADAGKSPLPIPPVLAPVLMMGFWMLLGAAAGIRLMGTLWRFADFQVGELSIAVPIGGIVGALAGGLLGLISNPRLQVLLMAVFAGASAGAVAGKLPWGDFGEVGGQVVGGLLGGVAWAVWLLIGRRHGANIIMPHPYNPEDLKTGTSVSDRDPRSFRPNTVQPKP